MSGHSQRIQRGKGQICHLPGPIKRQGFSFMPPGTFPFYLHLILLLSFFPAVTRIAAALSLYKGKRFYARQSHPHRRQPHRNAPALCPLWDAAACNNPKPGRFSVALASLPLPPAALTGCFFYTLLPQKPGSSHGCQSNPLPPACS